MMTPHTPTSVEEIEAKLARLKEGAEAFSKLTVEQNIELLDTLLKSVYDNARTWAEAGATAKGLSIDQPVAGEEWLAGPVITLRNIRLLKQTLTEIRDTGKPNIDNLTFKTRGDGRVTVEVFPQDSLDKVMFTGFSAEIWMEPGVDEEAVRSGIAPHWQQVPDPTLSLVLGAGNVSSIGPMDLLHKLFVERQVVALKMNPVNDYLGPIFENAFAVLVELGFLEIIYGGANEGSLLCRHRLVDNIHITGSSRTHDAIVWGVDDDVAQRKAEGRKMLDKPITSELGNVTPIIIVPGEWSTTDLKFQAENIATMVANNGSFNCNAGKLLVTAKGWPQREAFLDEIRSVLKQLPPRPAYYPGARERWESFTCDREGVELLVDDRPDVVPWTLITGLDPDKKDDRAFQIEPFCALLHEVPLDSSKATDFIPKAVAFCNETVWGTLATTIIIHPKTRKDGASEAAFQQALDDLRYGGIGVNQWAALVYALVTPTWGAHPGHTLEDIRSGIGVVHNTYMFDHPQKSVVYSPFRINPKPAWFATNRVSHLLGQKMLEFEAAPSVFKLPPIIWCALRG